MNGPADALFARYPAATRAISPIEPLGNAGGLSGARLYRFRSGLGPLVARLWPVDGPDPGRLARIHAWLHRAGDLGFVPDPLPSLDGRSLVEVDGRSWEVAPWMPGLADPSRPPGLGPLLLAFGGLAAFLGRLAAEGSEGLSPGLAHRASEIDRLVRGGFEAIRARLDRAPADPATPLARRWLDRAVPIAGPLAESTRLAASRPLPLQPCLRDARPDHFLFEGGRLSGLVDFGAMGVDSVAGDLARLKGAWLGRDPTLWGNGLGAFESIRPLSAAEFAAIGAFERANALLVPYRWVRWHFFDGRTFDDPQAVVRGIAKGWEALGELR